MSGQPGARKAAFDGAMRTETRGNQSTAKIRRFLRSQTFPGATKEKDAKDYPEGETSP